MKRFLLSAAIWIALIVGTMLGGAYKSSDADITPTLHAITLPGTYDIYPGDGMLVCHRSLGDSVACVILPPGSLIVIPKPNSN